MHAVAPHISCEPEQGQDCCIVRYRDVYSSKNDTDTLMWCVREQEDLKYHLEGGKLEAALSLPRGIPFELAVDSIQLIGHVRYKIHVSPYQRILHVLPRP